MQMISSILSKDEMYVGIQIKASHEMRLLRIKNPHCYFVSPYWLSLSPCMVVLLAGPDTYRLESVYLSSCVKPSTSTSRLIICQKVKMFHIITLAEAVPNEGETRNSIHPLVLFCRVRLEMKTTWQELQQTSQMGIIIVSTHCKTLPLRFIGRMNTDSVLSGLGTPEY